MEIKQSDLLLLLAQYLQDSNLSRTLEALSKETDLKFNFVSSKVEIENMIIGGTVVDLLERMKTWDLTEDCTRQVYILVFYQLLADGEVDLARNLLINASPLMVLRDLEPQLYLKFSEMENINANILVRHRQVVADMVLQELELVSENRLLELIGQAVKWQVNQGLIDNDGEYDILRGGMKKAEREECKKVSQCFKEIKFSKKQHPEICIFSPDGEYFVSGAVDGFVEVWNYMTGKLRKDLGYQAENKMMMMESAVLALGFSLDSQYLVAGGQNGKIKVWKVRSGQLMRKIPDAHTQGVTSVSFNKDTSQILSTSFDHTIRIHGLKSGKMLKEFRGHTSFVNHALYCEDYSKIISASSDGSIKIWDLKSTNCLRTVLLYQGKLGSKGISSPVVMHLTLHPKDDMNVIVADRSPFSYIINLDGRLIKSFHLEKPVDAHFVSSAISPAGKYIYAPTELGSVAVFDTDSGKLESMIQATDKEIIGLCHHPFSNIIAIYDEEGDVKFWKP